MANPWDADIDLSPDEAKRLVWNQFPEFRDRPFQLLSSGWDNTAYLVDDRFVFRFPRRQIAAALIEYEIKILPRLAPHLPLPISVSTLVGEPTESYPFVWAGHEFMTGNTACRMTWSNEQRANNAALLGSFLKALHAIPIDDAKSWAPGDEINRTDFQSRLPTVIERLTKLEIVLPDIPMELIKEMAHRLAARVPEERRTTWVHGDLYSRHLIANENREVVGVIDWGDVHLGDPALDLSIAFTFLPTNAHEIFRSAYGEISEEEWNNAKFRAISHAAAISDYGLGIGDDDLLRAAEFTLRSLTTG